MYGPKIRSIAFEPSREQRSRASIPAKSGDKKFGSSGIMHFAQNKPLFSIGFRWQYIFTTDMPSIQSVQYIFDHELVQNTRRETGRDSAGKTCLNFLFAPNHMVGRPLSKAVKRRLKFTDDDKCARKALEAYLRSKAAHARGEAPKAKSLRQVASEFNINYMKISRLSKPGAMAKAERNRSRGHLSIEEEEELANDIEISSKRGTPHTHQDIEDFVNHLLRNKYGEDFELVGRNWVDRFLERHRSRLKTFWARGLDSVRTGALNPASLAGWFNDVLGPNIIGVEPGLISGMDETGCPPEDACDVCVVGSRSSRGQVMKRAVNRQNVTVFVCITADGTYTKPHIIFKGAAFSSGWRNNNVSGAT